MIREPGSVPFQLDRSCVTGALNAVAVCMQTLTVPHVEGVAGSREGESERQAGRAEGPKGRKGRCKDIPYIALGRNDGGLRRGQHRRRRGEVAGCWHGTAPEQ
ncbi:hypothetical protein E2C01_018487 [Portunus trituberculatus]|uniref:Uncharacterized protein n=1 Tax=Portunus trituberculatus TaxID=210409 RepID=A0A5B7DV97_PORTR|nr:hypothetical protein [Portunus trituberculatus]